ncbi:neuropeptide Y receptor type 2-like [Acanthaster planci]|uniref:Neuropeptide Y receptor type 2-like n=1 Tax=Acanthaster planci TaxID=133434 RepID=A0A8B7ZVW0_ACAPL|nr:neuropeptide Y receptor type 2-like [Acanthaster planci]
MASNRSSTDLESAIGVLGSSPLDTVKTIISCLATLGNSAVIVVMLVRHKVFSSFTNRLILHQSFIDAAAGVVFYCSTVLKRPSTVVVSQEGNTADRLVCSFLFSDYFLWSLNVTSTYNLVIISLERFMGTCHPLKHRKHMNTTLKLGAVVTSWGVGFVYSFHLTLLVEPIRGRCQFVAVSHAMKICIGVLAFTVEYVLPILTMVYSYGKILIALTKNLVNPVTPRQHFVHRAKKNVLVTLLMVTTVFVICWTPSECYYVGVLVLNLRENETLYISFTTLLACNLFINPVIYSFIYHNFRFHLRDLVLGRFHRNRVENIAMNRRRSVNIGLP